MTRILLVEDEESYRDPLTYQLEREGFEVITAATGTEALARFDEFGADLVLLDLMLPGLPGTEVCRQLRLVSDVPVIMLTAKDDEIDKVVGLELGADDYVTKPYSSRELLARVRAVLRRRETAVVPAGGPAPLSDVEDDELLVAGPCGWMSSGTRSVSEAIWSRSPSRSSSCSRCCCATRAGCSRAASSSTASGAPTTWATPRRSTCTSSGSAPASRSTRATQRSS